jgi:hypothetical protein
MRQFIEEKVIKEVTELARGLRDENLDMELFFNVALEQVEGGVRDVDKVFDAFDKVRYRGAHRVERLYEFPANKMMEAEPFWKEHASLVRPKGYLYTVPTEKVEMAKHLHAMTALKAGDEFRNLAKWAYVCKIRYLKFNL